jgi:hypothetical protein
MPVLGRGIITLVTAPGDGEVTVVTDESMGEQDPLLAKLLTDAAAPAGPATKRQPLRGLGPTHPATSPRALRAHPSPARIVLDPVDRPVGKGTLCATTHAFNLQAATRVAANDMPGRQRLCRYILRPPLASDRRRARETVAFRSRLSRSSAGLHRRWPSTRKARRAGLIG